MAPDLITALQLKQVNLGLKNLPKAEFFDILG